MLRYDSPLRWLRDVVGDSEHGHVITKKREHSNERPLETELTSYSE
jgi:hypothetical protein